MLTDTLFGVVALLIVVVLALLVHIGRMKNKHANALAEADYKVFTKSFDEGWKAHANNYSALRIAIRTLEQDPSK